MKRLRRYYCFVAMTDGKKFTFRIDESDLEELKELAEELDMSASELVRGQTENLLEIQESDVEASPAAVMDAHAENLVEDEDYRNLHEAFYSDGRGFSRFVSEEEVFDTKWVDETTVDYDMMLEKFRDVVYSVQMGEYDEACSVVSDFEEQGYSQEAFLFSSVISEYED